MEVQEFLQEYGKVASERDRLFAEVKELRRELEQAEGMVVGVYRRAVELRVLYEPARRQTRYETTLVLHDEEAFRSSVDHYGLADRVAHTLAYAILEKLLANTKAPTNKKEPRQESERSDRV